MSGRAFDRLAAQLQQCRLRFRIGQRGELLARVVGLAARGLPRRVDRAGAAHHLHDLAQALDLALLDGMADQADVETVLAGLVSGVLYPQGVTAPSVLGVVCRVYRGWPNSAALDADLAAGVVNVTVFPQAGHERNTTRWPDECALQAWVSPTLTVSVDGVTATFAGAAGLGQVAGLLVDGVAVVHRLVGNDTPASVAASYWQLYQQPRSAWTFELEIRPFGEKW